MNGFTTNIEQDALENENFRKVLYTSSYMQLVVMALAPLQEIGEETHGQDQFIRVEEGEGKAVIDGEEHALSDGFAVVIPAGAKHNIINTSKDELMKLYTLYAPPHHEDGTVHKTKEEAEKDEEEFLGDTTE